MSGPAKVLVAEDDLADRKLLGRFVEALGHVPLCASNGALAWDLLQDNPDVRLVFADLVMPGLDGVELLRRARGTTAYKQLPFVLLTGQSDTQALAHLLEQGAVACVVKPVGLTDLRRAVRLVLEGVEPEQRLSLTKTSEWLSAAARPGSGVWTPSRIRASRGIKVKDKDKDRTS